MPDCEAASISVQVSKSNENPKIPLGNSKKYQNCLCDRSLNALRWVVGPSRPRIVRSPESPCSPTSLILLSTSSVIKIAVVTPSSNKSDLRCQMATHFKTSIEAIFANKGKVAVQRITLYFREL